MSLFLVDSLDVARIAPSSCIETELITVNEAHSLLMLAPSGWVASLERPDSLRFAARDLMLTISSTSRSKPSLSPGDSAVVWIGSRTHVLKVEISCLSGK